MSRPWKEIGRYGSVGLELVLTIGLVSWLGQWLDARYWGGHGRGLAAGFALGVAVAFRNLWRTAQRMQRDIEQAEARDPEAGRWTVDEGWVHGDPPDPPAPDAHEGGQDKPNRRERP